MPALRILGPLRLRGVTGDAALGGDKPRRLLAALALHANEAVSAGRLTEVVWGATPPRSARQNLQTYVWSLRRALKAAGDRGPLIEAVPPGYALRVEPEDLDWLRFVRLTAAAGECLARDPATASKLLREALGYWRGPVLADVADDLGALRPRIAAMEEARLSALEQRIQADLATGRHHELTGELAELAAAYPLRERLRAHQMLALYRCGRQAEALAAYHQLRAQLAEELGVDPGPEPQRLFEAMLRADPGLDVPAQPAAADAADGRWPRVPRQLPAQAAGFAGRAGELRRMDEFLAAAPAALLIVAVTGPPGAGKTALALHWAHRVQQRFGDGTLFADLHGWDPGRPAAEPAEVLDGFLRALAIRPEDIPPGVDERAALLRSVLDGKRVLIVLDNVPEPGQVRPLLPGSAGCLVLITSRSRLSGLAARDGAARIALGPLAEDEALALLRQVTDPCRVEAEPAAASEVTRLCGGLPLALRIAADRIAAQPALALSGLVDQLSDERARLRLLATDDDDTAVRAAFSSSYRGLGVPAARMFRLAGLHAGREFSVAAAAAAAGTDETDARDLLVLLAGAHLLDDTVPGRFRLHDLLAVYAAERAAAEDPPGPRDRALRRLLGWYLHTADAADRTLIPRRARPPLARPPDDCRPVTFGGYDEAFAWCETERENLVCATRQAVAAGELEIAWQLPAALGAYLKISRRWDDWIATHEAGLGAARRLGDAAAEAWLLSSLGGAHGDLRQFGRAAECFARALAIRRELGDRHGQAVTLLNMGFLHWKQRQFGDGIGCFRQSLAIASETGDRYAEAMALNNLGEAYLQLGRHGQALEPLHRALRAFRDTGDLYNQAMTLDSLGSSYGGTGDLDKALALFRESLGLRRQTGDRQGEAMTLDHIAQIRRARGEAAEARRCWQRALGIFEELGDPEASGIRARLAGPDGQAQGQGQGQRLYPLCSAARHPHPVRQPALPERLPGCDPGNCRSEHARVSSHTPARAGPQRAGPQGAGP